MRHRISPEDDRFRSAFEALQVEPREFDHAAHVRLAYVYLCEDSVEGAVGRMKRALLAFLAHLGVSESKYHETADVLFSPAARQAFVEPNIQTIPPP
jgi:hypothetical protein